MPPFRLSCATSLCAGLLATLLCVGLATIPSTAAAFPDLCDTPELTQSGQAGVYGGDWGRDSSLPVGSLLGCRRSGLPQADNDDFAFVASTLRAYSMRFVTSDAAQRRVPATALLLVPNTVPVHNQQKAPLIALASGTIGVADACAPSRTLLEGTSIVAPWVSHYLAKGLSVVVVDYLGLGTALAPDGEDHPYLEGSSSARVLLDALRAAYQVPGGDYRGVGSEPVAKIPASWPAALSGYSQGGFATLWATLQRPSYAAALPLRATVVGAPAVDLRATLLQVDQSIARSLIAYFLLGYANATDPATLHPASSNRSHLDGFLKPSGQQLLAAARTTCASELGLANALDTLFGAYSLNQLVDKNALLADARFSAWMAHNSVAPGGSSAYAAPATAVFSFHGALDGVVPFTPHRQLVVGQWATPEGGALWSGEASLARSARSWQTAGVGAHFTTSPLERNDSAAGSRYTPYEWLWDGLYGAPRSTPDLTP